MAMNGDFFIDEAANQIGGFGIIPNKKIEGPATVRELTTLLYQEHLLIFIRRFANSLLPISQDEILAKWEVDYKHNLCLQNECALGDFPDEFFYFVDMWQTEDGSKILVLSLNH